MKILTSLKDNLRDQRLRREQRRKDESGAHAEKKYETAAEIAAAKQTDTSWVLKKMKKIMTNLNLTRFMRF